MKLLIKKDCLDTLSSFKPRGVEEERCGLLIGERKSDTFLIEEVVEVKNVRKSVSEFELDPVETLKIFERVEDEGKQVVGVWHTHPLWKAHPSEKDIVGMRVFPGVWVIVSREEIRAFVLEDEVVEVDVVVV